VHARRARADVERLGDLAVGAVGGIQATPEGEATMKSSGTETWVVIAAAALTFAAGAGAARLAPVVRLRLRAS
jgi:hypothetical protein